MPVDGSEDRAPTSLYSPGSAALTLGGTEEDGGSAGGSQGSKAAASAYPANTEAGEGNSGKQMTI